MLLQIPGEPRVRPDHFSLPDGHDTRPAVGSHVILLLPSHHRPLELHQEDGRPHQQPG